MPVSSIVCCRAFIFLAFITLGTACTKFSPLERQVPADTVPREQPPTDTIVPLQALELLNEYYGQDPQQVMDIYLPAGRTPAITHIMVLIHGGGWIGGDKQDYTPHINNMKNRDARYAYVNLNYRLVKDGRNIFPAAEEDINAALEYLWSRADSFHISPLTGLIGTSAGAHLAALQGCKHNQKGYIRAMVCIMGVYDMKRFFDEGSAGVAPLVVDVLGGSPQQKPELYHSSSPISYISGQTPPALLIHGTEDTLARYSQAISMDSMLKKAGAVHEFYSFKGWHAIPADVVNEAAEKMFAHIDRYTK
ncbi:alpha/beta hydrolase [Chitinophaga sp. CF418]|uniref:alpha/beta hydrolase n=1 Tax=Chitinophaga sp. CF418 TaxID=1855287 RepID=UPI00092189C7|nr:alpha/beta hydrolase [Chitinophaga sp. CF418]SHM09657.1 Acetyl esterase/lipase [Chitinophaga sp. CF418]